MSDYFNSTVTCFKAISLQLVSNYDNSQFTKRQVTTAGTWSICASVKKMIQFSQKAGFKLF